MKTQMTNTSAFTSRREAILSLMEVTQNNFCRYALKLVNTLNADIINLKDFEALTFDFDNYCQWQKIDTTITF